MKPETITCTPVDKKRIFNETVFDIQTMVREQFKSLESGSKEEVNNTNSALQHQEKNEKEIREIVRQEFEKYLESMYRGTKPPNEKTQESEMIPDTLSKLVPALKTQTQNDVSKENKASSADTDKINISQQTTVHVPHKQSQLVRIHPNPCPATWRTEEPIPASSSNYQQGNVKSDIPAQSSGLFMSDKDSMQALYGIKSPEKQCLTKTEPCIQQSEVRLVIGRDKPNDYSEMIDTSSEPVIASQTKQVSERITDMIERNDGLITNIKAEPMSPPPVYVDRDETAEKRNISETAEKRNFSEKRNVSERITDMIERNYWLTTDSKSEPLSPPTAYIHRYEETAENRSSNDFVQRNSSLSYQSSATTVADSQWSGSSDLQNQLSDVRLHNKHITELESVIASIKEEVDVVSNTDNRRGVAAEMQDENSQKAPTNTGTSQKAPTNTGTSQSVVTTQSILPTQPQMMAASSCKTVAVLMPTKDRGYIAGVLEPSLGVTKALKYPEVYGFSTKTDKQTNKGMSSPTVNKTCISQSFNTSMMPNSSFDGIQNSSLPKRFTSLQELAGQNIEIQPSNIQTFGQNAAKADKKLTSTDKTAIDLSTPIDIATVEPLLTGASRKKEDGSISLSKACTAIQPLTQASLSQNLSMMPAPPVLQGPNKPAPSSSRGMSVPKCPKVSANQTLPQLSVQSPSSQSYHIPILPATIPSQSLSVMLGTQTISSLNIPVMSVNQAFSSLKTTTVSLSHSSQSSANEKENHSEKLDSTGPNTNKEAGNEASGEEKTNVKIIGSDIIVKKEKEDSTNNLTSDPQTSEQTITSVESLSTATVVQANSTVLSVSTSQSIPTSQILMGQNIPMQGSNQALPVQALQMQPGNQIVPGQAVQMLSPNQAFQCQTIPMWPGQIMPQQTLLNLSAIQGQSLQGITVSTPAKLTTVSAQSTTTTTTTAAAASSAEVTATSTSGKADVQSIPLQLVGAGQKGMVFQSQEVNSQCLFIPGQTTPVAPLEMILPKGHNSSTPPGKVPIARLKKNRAKVEYVLPKGRPTVKCVLQQKSRNNLPVKDDLQISSSDQTLEKMYKAFGAKSLLGKKLVEKLLFNPERSKNDSDSKTSDATSEHMSSEGETPLKSKSPVENKIHEDKSQSVNQTDYLPLNQANSGYSDSAKLALSESEKQVKHVLPVLKNQTVHIKEETVCAETKSSDVKHQTASENNQNSVKEIQPASGPDKPIPRESTEPKIIPDRHRGRRRMKKNVFAGNPADQGMGVSLESIAAGQQPMKIQPSPQISLQTGHNMLTFVPNNAQFGNNMLQNTVVLNQGVPMAVQQNPFIQTGFQPVQNMVLQSGQIIPQQMVYQPFQVQQGSMVLPQYVMTGTGPQSNTMMMVQQPQVMNVNTGNQPQVIMSGTQLNSVGQLPARSQPAGLQQSHVILSGTQLNTVGQPATSQPAGLQQNQVIMSGTQLNTVGQLPATSQPAGPQQSQVIMSGTQANSVRQPATSQPAGLQQSQTIMSGTQTNSVRQPATSQPAGLQQRQMTMSGTQANSVGQPATSLPAGLQQSQVITSGTQLSSVGQLPATSQPAGLQQSHVILSGTQLKSVGQPATSQPAGLQQSQVIMFGTQSSSVGQPATTQPVGLQQSQVIMSGTQANSVGQLPATSPVAGLQQGQVILSGPQSNPVATVGKQQSSWQQAGPLQSQLISSGSQSDSLPTVVQQPTISKQAGIQQTINLRPIKGKIHLG